MRRPSRRRHWPYRWPGRLCGGYRRELRARAGGRGVCNLMSDAGRGIAIGPDELFERLVERFGESLDVWCAGQAFDRIRAAWLDRALGLGERIAIQNGAGKREGLFEGIDVAGRLLMRSEHGLETIEAADMSLSSRSDVPPRRALSDNHRPEGPA